MLNPETEITFDFEDKLNRKEFARNLANNILNYEPSDCLTIGITGNWGSGKTSLIKLTLNKLKWEKDIIIIHFKPWFFSNQNNLYYQFFKLLISTLKDYELKEESLFKRKTTPKRKMFKKSKIENLEDYFNYIQSSNSKLDEKSFYSLNSDELESYISLETLKKQCDNYFDKELNYKIIVIIDDIDRLLKDEIKQIFTLVKSLANFKKFIYILSFDKKIVSEALNDSKSNYKEKFLEKIVQIQVRIPDITRSKINEILETDIEPTYNKYHRKNHIDKEDNFEQIQKYLEPFIENIRDLKRYKNMLDFYLTGFIEDININDCFLIIALQLFEYKVFLLIKKNETLLTTKISNPNESDHINNFYNDVEKNLEKINMEEMKKLLEYLFPMLKYQNIPSESIKGNFNYWNKKHKIASTHHFNKYFTLSLEDSEVNVKTITKLIKSTNRAEINKIINPNNNNEYNNSLLTQLSLVTEEIPQKNSILFIDAFLKEDNPLTINENNRHHINSIIDKLLLKYESNEECYKLLKKYIELNKNLFTICDYIHHAEIKINNEINGIYELLVNATQLDELKLMLVKKIKKCNENKELFNHPRLTTILTYLRLWDGKDSVNHAVCQNTLTNNDLIEFLKKYQNFSQITQHYMGEYNSLEIIVNFDLLKSDCYDDLDKLCKRVKQILINDKLPEKDKDFCKKFIEQYKRYKKQPK